MRDDEVELGAVDEDAVGGVEELLELGLGRSVKVCVEELCVDVDGEEVVLPRSDVKGSPHATAIEEGFKVQGCGRSARLEGVVHVNVIEASVFVEFGEDERT